jgi:hypothetical protein
MEEPVDSIRKGLFINQYVLAAEGMAFTQLRQMHILELIIVQIATMLCLKLTLRI